VVLVDSVEDEKEAIERMNNTDYGLVGGVYTQDKEKASRIAKEIKAGTVLVNSSWNYDGRMPVSGRKLSGRNTLLSKHCFVHFYQTKSIYFKF
jgi:acyl-CoA reductase-like NAD-dependent aldehyde dehydrogenase